MMYNGLTTYVRGKVADEHEACFGFDTVKHVQQVSIHEYLALMYSGGNPKVLEHVSNSIDAWYNANKIVRTGDHKKPGEMRFLADAQFNYTEGDSYMRGKATYRSLGRLVTDIERLRDRMARHGLHKF